MTKQIIRPMNVAPNAAVGCKTCKLYEDVGVFELCKHTASEYHIGPQVDYHTIQHMRGDYGQCGTGMKLKAVK